MKISELIYKHKQLVVTFYKESERYTMATVWSGTVLAVTLYLAVGRPSPEIVTS